ncbi:hypothetical protein Q0Z83_082640 [Actinoplanes sichuanensis]|uniref:Uncharacterized protein n=1 Tax=Actinoplanes sichuanensis TaxID=512349 RepID=A0ABW4ADH7_9ACTN|nr:hypothetical protein [Actinoplanes sichuanensis]BEL10073.1 hypothetical protein Q0Z83_082640 [Actinoplanes sichuanensis]
MTTDQLKDLFDELREETVPTIRPPGAAAARRTLRRRRATTAAVSAAAAVVAIAGGITVVAGHREPAPRLTPAPPAASASTGPERTAPQLTGPERTALNAIADGRPMVTVTSPVVAGYQWAKKIYPPVVEFTAACAGTGEITLTVTGGSPLDHNRFKTHDMPIKVLCTSSPEPVRAELMTPIGVGLTVRLTDAKGAGRSGFAFSLLGTGDEEFAPDDKRLDIESLVGGPSGELDDGRVVRAGGGVPSFEPGHGLGPSGWTEVDGNGPYDLVMACRGAGTYTLELRLGAQPDMTDVQNVQPTGPPVVAQTIPCTAAPQRYSWPVSGAIGTGVTIWEDYENTTDTTGTVAWSLVSRE